MFVSGGETTVSFMHVEGGRWSHILDLLLLKNIRLIILLLWFGCLALLHQSGVRFAVAFLAVMVGGHVLGVLGRSDYRRVA